MCKERLRIHDNSAILQEVQNVVESCTDELTIFMLKPQTFDRANGDTDLVDWVTQKTEEAGLRVECVSERQLPPHEVCEMYLDVLKPTPEDDAQWGVKWKKELISYMTSGPVCSFLISGKGSVETAKAMKKELRKAHFDGSIESKIIKNVAHTPENGEFNTNLRVLFLDGISPNECMIEETI